ncbi:MAG: hypothetical protein NZQ09_15210, partial [Chloroflexus sp.]|nr:hypothetical protein [Chloroflexus sp.]
LFATVLAMLALPAPALSAASSIPTTPRALNTTTPIATLRTGQAPEESLIGALLGRYAMWLLLVMCSSMLALAGAAAIVARMRRIAGDDDD